MLSKAGRTRSARLTAYAARVALACAVPIVPASAHPHIFVDGGIDFVFSGGSVLEALNVTWLYDEFETLYILSSYGLSLNADEGLEETDRQELVRVSSDWSADFDGSAHVMVEGEAAPLARPSEFDAHLIDGRLQITFTRRLEIPIEIARRSVETAFYESTYFYAFSITQEPELLGDVDRCEAQVIPFEPDTEKAEFQSLLSRLGREQTPAMANVGALFADRVELKCA